MELPVMLGELAAGLLPGPKAVGLITLSVLPEFARRGGVDLAGLGLILLRELFFGLTIFGVDS